MSQQVDWEAIVLNTSIPMDRKVRGLEYGRIAETPYGWMGQYVRPAKGHRRLWGFARLSADASSDKAVVAAIRRAWPSRDETQHLSLRSKHATKASKRWWSTRLQNVRDLKKGGSIRKAF